MNPLEQDIFWNKFVTLETSIQEEALKEAANLSITSFSRKSIGQLAKMIAEKAYKVFSDKVMELKADNEELKTILLASSKSDFLSIVGSLREKLVKLLREKKGISSKAKINAITLNSPEPKSNPI